MTVTIVDAQSTGVGAPTAGTTGVTVTKPTGLADGDVMYAFVSRTDFANNAAWTCSGWTNIGPAAASAGSTTGNDTQTTILRKVVTSAAGEPSTYTFVNTQSTTYQSIGIIVALRGVDNTTPEDIAVPAYGFTSNNINPASLNATSATANAFVIAYLQISLAAQTSGAGGAPSTYTLVPNGNTFAIAGGSLDNKAYTAYKTLGAAGATTGTNVWTNASDPGAAESLTAVVLVRAATQFGDPRHSQMSRTTVGRMLR